MRNDIFFIPEPVDVKSPRKLEPLTVSLLTAAEVADALRLLSDNGLARVQNEVDSESGRPVERWFATGST